MLAPWGQRLNFIMFRVGVGLLRLGSDGKKQCTWMIACLNVPDITALIRYWCARDCYGVGSGYVLYTVRYVINKLICHYSGKNITYYLSWFPDLHAWHGMTNVHLSSRNSAAKCSAAPWPKVDHVGSASPALGSTRKGWALYGPMCPRPMPNCSSECN